MLEKPNFADSKIIDCLKQAYNLNIIDLTFLPLGADVNTVVYRAVANNATPYFVKLRSGDFLEASVAVPKHLHDLGTRQVIAPLPTQTGRPWADLEPYKVILYPFVDGHNGFQVGVSAQQRVEFGQTLKQFHTTDFPAHVTRGVRQEQFSSQWRDKVTAILTEVETAVSTNTTQTTFPDPLSQQLATFLHSKQGDILSLIQRTDQLAQRLQDKPSEYILCHADMHGWNMLIDNNDNFYIVDWDTLVFAPKERDLMFVGCGLGGHGQESLEEEEKLFYQGYGMTEVDQTILAYYRYDRLIEDIAEFCGTIFGSTDDSQDRKRGLKTLQANFEPNNTLDLARRLDKAN